MKLKPWWFCCGWRSYWCVLDTAMHELLPGRRSVRWVCDRHDRHIIGLDWPEVHEADLARRRANP